jgi:alkyl hydroperoxide reductase subunit AhpF
MSLLGPDDQERLREEFARLTRRVHLIYCMQSVGCETCAQTRRILDELPPLSDRIVIDEVNFVLEPDRAKAYGIDRVPGIAVASEDPSDVNAALRDSRIRFLGTPSGYEFISLVHAVLLAGTEAGHSAGAGEQGESVAGGGAIQLSETSRARLGALTQPVTLQVFTTPT